jgi:methanethiol S-methyltransferase
MKRLAVFAFGMASYAVFFASFCYGICFVGNLPWVPRTIDAGGASEPAVLAALIDVALIAAFGLHHSAAARARLKKLVPASIERNVYVLLASLLLDLLWWQWRPIPRMVWSLEGAASVLVTGVVWAGWGLVLLSTFAISHWDLFGLRQAVFALRGRKYEPVPFRQPVLYRLVRHPLLLGLLIAFWATPAMSVGHVLFAGVMTAYILIGMTLEERDLVKDFGETYREYRRRVPALLPFLRPRGRADEPAPRGGAGSSTQ